MKLPALLTAALVLLFAASAEASVTITVTSNSASPQPFASSAGAVLANGCLIRVGYFNISSPADMNTIMTSNDYNAVNSLFKALAEVDPLVNPDPGKVSQANNAGGSTLIVNGQFTSGNFLGQITNINASYISTNTDLSVWVFNSNSVGTATEWGIFSATTGWEFPADLGNSTLNTNEIDTIQRGSFSGGQYRLSSIAPVPEPGSLTLLLASAGTLLVRRRRR